MLLKKLINWKPRYNNLEFMLKSAIKWEKKYTVDSFPLEKFY